MTDMLYVRCPNCQHTFPSGFAVPPEALGAGNSTECPRCSTPVLVSTETVFIPE